jgi:hypothetical protein
VNSRADVSKLWRKSVFVKVSMRLLALKKRVSGFAVTRERPMATCFATPQLVCVHSIVLAVVLLFANTVSAETDEKRGIQFLGAPAVSMPVDALM